MEHHLNEDTNMPLKTVSNIIAVWILNGISWLIAFTTHEWLDGLAIVKEVVAILSLLVAIAFTLYKFKQAWKGWKGWNPKSKRLQ